MRRDYGSEILVAIGAISVLVFAVAFAVILIVSQQANAVPSATPAQGVIVASPTLDATDDPTVTLAASATTTSVPPTATQDRAIPSATATQRAATTEAPTMTSSPLPPSATLSLPSATATQRRATTVASIATNTARPPSATATPRASATVPPTATHTSVPPSATPTATFTPSATPVPPTATPSATATATVTNTASPTPTPSPTTTNTPTARPTATLLPATPTSLVSADGCPIPAGWVAYTVQEGDTLFSLARISGSAVSDIRAGNCLPNETIFALQTLYLPLPGSNNVAAGAVDGCNAAGVSLDHTLVGQTVSGVFEVRGTANIDNFAYYRVEVLPPGANAYVEVRRSFRPVVDGVLARVSATRFAPGEYRLRLVVVDARGGFPQPCDIPVIIQ